MDIRGCTVPRPRNWGRCLGQPDKLGGWSGWWARRGGPLRQTVLATCPMRWSELKRSSTRIVAVIVTAGVVLAAAACGGSQPSSTGHGRSSETGGTSSGSMSSELLALSQCMRAHGVPSFPDPQPGATNAKFPSAQQLGVGTSQFLAAQRACESMLPAGVGDVFPPAEVQELLAGMLRFSQCMRSHGVPNWPDPTTDSEGRPLFVLSGAGISRAQAHSPEITRPEGACQHLLPSALGGIPVG